LLLIPDMSHDKQHGSPSESFHDHAVELPIAPYRPRHRSSVTFGVAAFLAVAGIVTVFPGIRNAHQPGDARAIEPNAQSAANAQALAAAPPAQSVLEQAAPMDSAPPMDIETENPPAEFMPGSAADESDASALAVPTVVTTPAPAPAPASVVARRAAPAAPTKAVKSERKSGYVSAPGAAPASAVHPLDDGLTGKGLPASGLDPVPNGAPALPSPGQPNGNPSPTPTAPTVPRGMVPNPPIAPIY